MKFAAASITRAHRARTRDTKKNTATDFTFVVEATNVKRSHRLTLLAGSALAGAAFAFATLMPQNALAACLVNTE